MEEDYLIHYGVLGMKWGMRRAAKKGTSYSYKSLHTKSLEKRAAKATAKGKKKASYLTDKAAESRASDKRRVDYAKKTSTGKAIAQNILATPFGSGMYQKLRANNVSRGKAIVGTVANLSLSPLPYFTGYGIGNAVGTRKVKKKNYKNK